MILFYDKKTGKIFATIDGRVHDERQLNAYVSNGQQEIGKYIIGWIEGKGGQIESNMDKMKILQKFEDITPESPLDYKIDIKNNKLIKIKK
jgi:hypothetical protein